MRGEQQLKAMTMAERVRATRSPEKAQQENQQAMLDRERLRAERAALTPRDRIR